MSKSNSCRLSLLSGAGSAAVITAAKKILSDTGMELADPVLLKALQSKGAKVGKDNRVYLPITVVEQALAELDKTFDVKTVSGKALRLDGRNRYYGSLTVDPFIVRYGQKPRRPVLEDVARHARLGDWLKRSDITYKMDMAFSDVAEDMSDLLSLQAFMSNTTNAYFCAPANLASAKRWLDMSEIMAGGSLIQNPILVGYVDTKTPLHMGAEGGEMLRLLLDHGAIMRSGPCAMAGGTSPYSLAGTITLSLAEILFFVTACWAYQPDSKVLLGAGPHYMNMASGQAWYFGPAKNIMHGAMAEVLGQVGLPLYMGCFSSGPMRLDFRTAFETVLSASVFFHRRVDIFGGLGALGNACGFSPELLLWQAELLSMLDYFDSGIDCSGKKLAVAAVENVGPRGQFMDDDLTLELLRSSEFYSGEIFDYQRIPPDEDWLELAAGKVEQVFSEHNPAVPEDRLEKLDRYVHDKRHT